MRKPCVASGRRATHHLVLLLSLLLPWPALAADSVRLLVWDEFVGSKTLLVLKNRHGLKVELTTFTSPEERDRLLQANPAGYDVLVADEIGMAGYRRRGLLETLDVERIPASRQSIAYWKTSGDALPYLWGYTGIAWRTDRLPQPPSGYAELLALAQQQPGRISLLDDSVDALFAVAHADGGGGLQTTADVQRAANALARHRRQGLRLVGSELGEDSPWLGDGLLAGQAYNGDIAFLRDQFQAPLAFAIPASGCRVWLEQLAILRNARDKAAAHRLLAALNEPKLAAANAEAVRYAPANPLSLPFLGEGFRNDPVIRPAPPDLKTCARATELPAPVQQAIDKLDLR